MMGLSWECEPIFRKLETHFRNKIEFRYVMAGLVRYVSEFMTFDEIILEPEDGIKKYNQRLAKIYLSEEFISGMPICMENFNLFDNFHRSSYPLDIAYKAVELAEPEKAENFLYNLRYATIIENRKITLDDELIKIAEKTGICIEKFLKFYSDGSAEAAFIKDKNFSRELQIYSLPAYLVQYEDKAVSIKNLINYETFSKIIRDLSENKIKPEKIENYFETLEFLFARHQIISSVELREALDIDNNEKIISLLKDFSLEFIKVKDEFFYFPPCS